MPRHGDTPLVTDVRPDRDGRWLATCDCGQSSVQDAVEDGWTWVLEHDCAAAR